MASTLRAAAGLTARRESATTARPVAVVLFESGDIEAVHAGDVTIDDAKGLFKQYAWMGSEDQ